MRRGRGDSEQMERGERGWRGQVRGRAKGGEVRRSRGTRRRGSGRKRETIVRVSLVDQREMRIARLGWPLGRLSWGPNRVREVGRGPSLRLSSSSSFPPPLLRLLLLLLLPLSRGDHRVFIMSVLCTLRSFLFSLSLSSLLRRAKMVHGRSRAPISPRILRAEDRPLLLYPAPAPPLPVLPLYSPRFFAPAASQSPRRGFSSRYSFLYARDCIVRSFNAL